MKRDIKSPLAYGMGAFGHDAFYGMLNGYLMMFVTSVLFAGSSKAYMGRMIAAVTLILTVVRIGELVFDPMFGGLIDATKSKWGKYRPWIIGTSTVSAGLSLLVFSNFWGLATSNATLYLILFTIAFVLFYVAYSIKDIAFWGMLPALSTSSEERGLIATFARIGSTIGANIITFAYVAILTLFSGSSNFTLGGWFGFIAVVAGIQVIGSYIAAFGTKENTSAIVNKKTDEKLKISQVIKTLTKNDQLLWTAVAYLIYGLGLNLTNNLMIYFFRYVIDAQNMWQYVGVIGIITGFIAIGSFPLMSKFLKRRQIFIVSVLVVLLAIIIFGFSTNAIVTLGAYVLYNLAQPLVFMVIVLTITDSVEYGQLKTGQRSEATTSAIRPMTDKLGGAIGGLVVGIVIPLIGMTGSATASDISEGNKIMFRIVAFAVPIVFILVGLAIYMTKVKLTESRHAEIVKELALKNREV